MLGTFRAVLACGLTVVVGASTAACGGSEGESAAQAEIEIRAAQEPPRTMASRLAKLLATTRSRSDCDAVEAVNRRSLVNFDCPPPASVAEGLRDFKIVGAEEFDTAAVVDYRAKEAPDGAAIALFVSPDRQWGVTRFGIVTPKSVGTSDVDARAGYERAVEDYLAALARSDCDAYLKVAITDGGTRDARCKAVREGSDLLVRRLTANPQAEPSYAGGNDTFGFFTLDTGKPYPIRNTISVMRVEGEGGERYWVLGWAPSPTEAAIRRVMRKYREQEKSGGGMSPSAEKSTSRKAD
jgi:hypothetical protein